MPFVANTPESLLARSDSKKPDSTCRGVTSNGLPCRRPLASPPRTPLGKKTAQLAPDDESLYCWQHKDQAGHSSRSTPARRVSSQATPGVRSSLDTLADRLGLVELNKDEDTHSGKKHRQSSGQSKTKNKPKKPKEKKASSMRFCFCFSIPLEEVNDTPRPRPQPRPMQQPDHQQSSRPPMSSVPVPASNASPPSKRPQQQQHLSPSRPPPGDSSPSKNSYRSTKSTASSTTAAHLKALIPDSLDVPTTSALMAELARPVTESDEPGYIYMFWLTPVSASSPAPVDAVRSLLAPPSSSIPSSRRASDVVSTFAGHNTAGKDNKTMLLKIGRAANVQRRMNQWSRQCGYSIEMLRYYPYLPSSSSDSSTTPHMTPHCKKVERLVHLELTGMGLRAKLDTCKACGKEHREWFEVEASREGIRRVDEVIRRWTGWDDGTMRFSTN